MIHLSQELGLQYPTSEAAVNYLPWTNPLENVTFYITELPESKKDLTEDELSTIGQTIEINKIKPLLADPDNQHYFTDGSVDPDTGTAGAAVLAVFRTNDNLIDKEILINIDTTVGSMITELVAIKAALAHSKTIPR